MIPWFVCSWCHWHCPSSCGMLAQPLRSLMQAPLPGSLSWLVFLVPKGQGAMEVMTVYLVGSGSWVVRMSWHPCAWEAHGKWVSTARKGSRKLFNDDEVYFLCSAGNVLLCVHMCVWVWWSLDSWLCHANHMTRCKGGNGDSFCSMHARPFRMSRIKYLAFKTKSIAVKNSIRRNVCMCVFII